MSYLAFLMGFLVAPILLLMLLHLWDQRRGIALVRSLQGLRAKIMMAVLVIVALVYTTPWDNYLVATGVWYYDPDQVLGIVLGWVPLEEYVFFMLQPLFVGLWLLWWARRLPVGRERNSIAVRLLSTGIVGIIWLGSMWLLFSGWKPGTYLALEVTWALPAIMIQLLFGADIVLRHWRLALVTLVPLTLYLALADTIAIREGTWTIDPTQSLGILLWGKLPVEEFVFFLLTTVLITLGFIVGIATASQERLQHVSNKATHILNIPSSAKS